MARLPLLLRVSGLRSVGSREGFLEERGGCPGGRRREGEKENECWVGCRKEQHQMKWGHVPTSEAVFVVSWLKFF